MKKFLKVMALAMVAVMMLSLTACSSYRTVDQIKEKGVIIMATNAEFEPFEFKDGDQCVGIDVDIANKIAEKLGVELEIHDVMFDATISEVQSGKADFVAAGMTIDEDRLKNVDFTNTYFEAGQAILVAKDSDIKGAADLAGKKVGVQSGTTGDIYCTDEDGENGMSCEVVRFPKGMDAVMALSSGKVDAVVIDNFPAKKLAEKNADTVVMLEEMLTSEEYAIGVAKGNTELVDLINEVLKEMQDSGELDTIISGYMGEE